MLEPAVQLIENMRPYTLHVSRNIVSWAAYRKAKKNGDGKVNPINLLNNGLKDALRKDGAWFFFQSFGILLDPFDGLVLPLLRVEFVPGGL